MINTLASFKLHDENRCDCSTTADDWRKLPVNEMNAGFNSGFDLSFEQLLCRAFVFQAVGDRKIETHCGLGTCFSCESGSSTIAACSTSRPAVDPGEYDPVNQSGRIHVLDAKRHLARVAVRCSRQRSPPTAGSSRSRLCPVRIKYTSSARQSIPR
jgi:hypothetical protein